MIAVFVNALAIIIGSGIGLVVRRGIPEKISAGLMNAVGLCILYIGWSGSLQGESALVLIVSMTVGIIIGEGIDLDKRLNEAVGKLEKKFHKEGDSVSLGEGFITGTLFFCIGAMAVVGSVQAGLSNDYEMLFTKSVLDFISATIFASTLGLGIMLSAVSILLFEGVLVLLAQVIAPYLTDAVVAEMTCVGSVLIFGLGLNLLGITKFKVLNFLPAVFLPILLTGILSGI